MKYVKSLDGLRAIAILLVMSFHFFYALEVGWVGVQLFFVLSGYLITTILVETKELDFSSFIKRFYWRRILRIFPLYYLYILIVAAIFLFANLPENFLQMLPYLLTYSYNFMSIVEGFEIDLFFTHFWSLAIEEQFYLFWPFLIFFIKKHYLKHLLIGVILFSPICRYVFAQYLFTTDITPFEAGELIYRLTPGQFDSFAFGALIPVFNLSQKVKSPKKLAGFITILSVIICGLNYFSLKNMGIKISPSSLGLPIGGVENFQYLWSYSLIGLFSFSMILLVVKSQNSKYFKPLKLLLENKIMIETGKISYGLYVYHWLILVVYRKLVHPYIPNLALSFVLYFIIVFIVSYASFEVFEKRFLVLKDKRFKLPSKES